MSDIVARQNDVVLYERDARLFGPSQWLNDQCIAYAFECLGENVDARIVLLEPSTLFMAKMLGDSAALREVLSQPCKAGAVSLMEQLVLATLVFMPINDKTDPDEHEGGGHWSLLVFRRDGPHGDRFEHYDSCAPANAVHARAAVDVLTPLLISKAPWPKLVKMRSPLQANGFDCGMYVLAIAELLCRSLPALNAGVTFEVAREAAAAAVRELAPAAVTAKRAEWLERVRTAS